VHVLSCACTNAAALLPHAPSGPKGLARSAAPRRTSPLRPLAASHLCCMRVCVSAWRQRTADGAPGGVDELEVEARRRIDLSQPAPRAGSTVKVNVAFMPHAPAMAGAIDCDGYPSHCVARLLLACVCTHARASHTPYSEQSRAAHRLMHSPTSAQCGMAQEGQGVAADCAAQSVRVCLPCRSLPCEVTDQAEDIPQSHVVLYDAQLGTAQEVSLVAPWLSALLHTHTRAPWSPVVPQWWEHAWADVRTWDAEDMKACVHARVCRSVCPSLFVCLCVCVGV
jgi:hypothetical protein